MSKHELRSTAYKNSGVTYDESQEAITITPSIYERIGKEDGCRELSQLFYDSVFSLKDDRQKMWFLNIFSSSTKQEAVDNQFRFFVQTFGGPNLYAQKKGKYTRLVGRHANYNISTSAANLWVELMSKAVDGHASLKDDDEARRVLKRYFSFTAHYIVAGMEYMRPDQLSGGTQIDAGRVW